MPSQIALTELLQTREIAHPSSIEEIALKSSEAEFRISGYPWWRESSKVGSVGNAKVILRGIIEGCVTLDPLSAEHDIAEDLENFRARPTNLLAWAAGETGAIYCRAGHPTPLTLHAEFETYLQTIGCPFPANRYLNCGSDGSALSFREIAASSSCMLMRGPRDLYQYVCCDLEKHGIPHSVLLENEHHPLNGYIYVELGSGFFICEDAYAIFD